MTPTDTTNTAAGEQAPAVMHAADAATVRGLDPLPAPVADTSTTFADEPPAPSPASYRIPRLAPIGEEASPEHAKTAIDLAHALHAAEFPVDAGSALAGQIHRAGQNGAPLDDVARQQHEAKTRAQLAKLYGDAAPVRIAAAQQLVREMEAKRPGFVALLERTGAGNDPLVISLLADAAARRAARRK